MEALDYLVVLNDDIKEKLIGLCLDRKLKDDFNEDGETLYDEFFNAYFIWPPSKGYF